MKSWKRAICFCAVVAAMLAVEACQKDSGTAARIPDVSGGWEFRGWITHNNCVGFFFLPPGTPRDLNLTLLQNGNGVTGMRNSGSFWSLAEGSFLDGTNDGQTVKLQIINSLIAWPPSWTWPGQSGTSVATAADSAQIDCRLVLTGKAAMYLTGSQTHFAAGDSLPGTISGPVYRYSGDCGTWIAPVPCDMTVSGYWHKL